MLCEKYKPALIESAVSGAELACVIQAHVAACPSCATELAQQRSLVAAIDTSLNCQMNVPFSAAMLQRFEASLAQQPQPKPAPRLTQVFASTLATLAVAAAIIVLLPRHDSEPKGTKKIATQPSQHQVDVSRPMTMSSPPPQVAAATSSHAHIPKRTQAHVVSVSTASTHSEPEVLVPPDERIAFDQLIANLNNRQRLAAAISKPIQEQPEQRVAAITTPEIETASLVVRPLQDSVDR